jgi:hypothetical protein
MEIQMSSQPGMILWFEMKVENMIISWREALPIDQVVQNAGVTAEPVKVFICLSPSQAV